MARAGNSNYTANPLGSSRFSDEFKAGETNSPVSIGSHPGPDRQSLAGQGFRHPAAKPAEIQKSQRPA
jgi:hypothetical protein